MIFVSGKNLVKIKLDIFYGKMLSNIGIYDCKVMNKCYAIRALWMI